MNQTVTYAAAEILSNSKHTAGNAYLMRVAAEAAARPGQFYMLGLDFPLLPRPLSVCHVEEGIVTFCYLVVGQGTDKLSRLRAGDTIQLTGPLGNGFDVPYINRHAKVALVSGGIGVAPFVELARHLTTAVDSFCGFASGSYLTDLLPHPHIATEDGSEGCKGYVTDLFDAADYDLVVACGPEGFSRAVTRKCADAGRPLLISMDTHMACGVGACLTCTCKTTAGNKRCCVDGPVFRGEELVFDGD